MRKIMFFSNLWDLFHKKSTFSLPFFCKTRHIFPIMKWARQNLASLLGKTSWQIAVRTSQQLFATNQRQSEYRKFRPTSFFV